MKYPYGNPATLEGYKEYWLKVIKEYRDDEDEVKLGEFEINFSEAETVIQGLKNNLVSLIWLKTDGCEQFAFIETELDKLETLFEELRELCE